MTHDVGPLVEEIQKKFSYLEIDKKKLRDDLISAEVPGNNKFISPINIWQEFHIDDSIIRITLNYMFRNDNVNRYYGNLNFFGRMKDKFRYFDKHLSKLISSNDNMHYLMEISTSVFSLLGTYEFRDLLKETNNIVRYPFLIIPRDRLHNFDKSFEEANHVSGTEGLLGRIIID
jgi:hypothetical protein